MVSSKEVITNVVSRLDEIRREDLHSLHSEYTESHTSINDLIEVSWFDLICASWLFRLGNYYIQLLLDLNWILIRYPLVSSMIEQSWKRKIIETGSITNYKKSKVDFYG